MGIYEHAQNIKKKAIGGVYYPSRDVERQQQQANPSTTTYTIETSSGNKTVSKDEFYSKQTADKQAQVQAQQKITAEKVATEQAWNNMTSVQKAKAYSNWLSEQSQTVKYPLTSEVNARGEPVNYIQKTIPAGAKPEDYAPDIPIFYTLSKTTKSSDFYKEGKKYFEQVPKKKMGGLNVYQEKVRAGSQWNVAGRVAQNIPVLMQKEPELKTELISAKELLTSYEKPIKPDTQYVGSGASGSWGTSLGDKWFNAKEYAKQIYGTANIKVRHDLTYKYLPSVEEVQKKGRQNYFEIQQKLKENPNWKREEFPIKDIYSSYDTRTENALNFSRGGLFQNLKEFGSLFVTDIPTRSNLSDAKYDPKMISAVKQGKTWEQFRNEDFMFGAGSRLLYTVREHPIKIGAIVGLGFATGGIGTILSGISRGVATGVEVTGIGLGTAYGSSVYGRYKNAKTSYERGEVTTDVLVEMASFGIGSKIGTKTAIYGGVIPQPSLLPKPVYEHYSIKTPEGKIITTQRYLGWVNKGTGQGGVIVGYGYKNSGVPKLTEITGTGYGFKAKNPFYSEKSFFLGTEKSIGSLDFGGVSKGSVVSLGSNPQRLITRTLLQRYGTANELTKFDEIYRIAKSTARTPSTVYSTEFAKPKSFKTQEGFDYALNTLGKQRTFLFRHKNILFGSETFGVQIKGGYAQVGTPADIDVMRMGTYYGGKVFTKRLSSKLNQLGENTFVTSDQPLLIQSNVGGKTVHLLDIHTPFQPQLSGEASADSFFGLAFNQKPIKIGKQSVVPLSESGLRASSSITVPRIDKMKIFSRDNWVVSNLNRNVKIETLGKSPPPHLSVKIAPEEHRTKDISRFFTIQTELAGAGQLAKLTTLYPSSLINLKSTYSAPIIQSSLPAMPIRSKYVKYAIESYSPRVSSKMPSSSKTSISSMFSSYSSSSLSPSSLSPSLSASAYSYSPSSISPSPSISISPSLSPSSPSPYSPSPSYSSPPSSRDMFRDLGEGGRKFISSEKNVKQAKAYNPTIYSVGLNIRGKKPSKFEVKSGLGNRPITMSKTSIVRVPKKFLNKLKRSF